jgi:hypothetical protein
MPEFKFKSLKIQKHANFKNTGIQKHGKFKDVRIEKNMGNVRTPNISFRFQLSSPNKKSLSNPHKKPSPGIQKPPKIQESQN